MEGLLHGEGVVLNFLVFFLLQFCFIFGELFRGADLDKPFSDGSIAVYPYLVNLGEVGRHLGAVSLEVIADSGRVGGISIIAGLSISKGVLGKVWLA